MHTHTSPQRNRYALVCNYPYSKGFTAVRQRLAAVAGVKFAPNGGEFLFLFSFFGHHLVRKVGSVSFFFGQCVVYSSFRLVQ